MYFSYPTNKAFNVISDYMTNFNCTKILIFKGVKNYECRWVDDQNLVAMNQNPLDPH